MVVVKNKSISLLWDSCKIFEKKFYCFDPQHGRLVTWLQTKKMPLKNTITLFVVPPKFCIKIVFNFSRGASPNGPREIENNAYAKFWRDNKQYNGIF